MKPELVTFDGAGLHNRDLPASIARLDKAGVYKDQSIIVILPTLSTVAAKAAASWWSLIFPPNQKTIRLFPMMLEVGDAYSTTIEQVLDHSELRRFRYILTLEADNVVPADGLLKLLARMEANPHLSAISGLYWTKGEGGVPQIWGDVKDPVLNFRPQPPQLGQLVECCGIGMGFALWRTRIFKDDKLRRPWFRTLSGPDGVSTQDLYFWGDARKYGYRCAVDCDVLVGHVDNEGFVW